MSFPLDRNPVTGPGLGVVCSIDCLIALIDCLILLVGRLVAPATR